MGGGGGGGDIAIIASSSRSRSLIRDLRQTLDLDPSLTTFSNIIVENARKFNAGIELLARGVSLVVCLFYMSEPITFRRCLVNLF